MLSFSLPEAILAFFAPTLIFLLLLALHIVLPAWRVSGYVRDEKSNKLLEYRLNGLVVFAIAVLTWWFEIGGIPRDWLFRATFYSIAGSSVLAVVLTAILVTGGSAKHGAKHGASIWAGRVLNKSYFERVDFKMYLYIFGGTMLALNALSGVAYHWELYGFNSNVGLFLYAGMWLFFVTDYFCFERVQLYTYDIIHERLGLKLIWGCLTVYPYLYVIPLWGITHFPAPEFERSIAILTHFGSLFLFLIGWVVSRGSNLQKYTFKRWPERKFLGFMKPESITIGDRGILCSGFWGVARHINYLGEFLIALAMALVLGHFLSFWVWIYPIFIVGLFVHRQRTDDVLCAEKYGSAWEDYCKRTRYRIIPGIY